MPREVGRKVIASNRKARHDYTILDTYEAGVVLVGTEVKSLRLGRASLVDSFATVDDGEVWLRGLHIPEYDRGTWTNHEPRRTRKMLGGGGSVLGMNKFQQGLRTQFVHINPQSAFPNRIELNEIIIEARDREQIQ